MALGRALILLGADARQVLELFFDPVKKSFPTSADAYLASGQLALEKHDYALAAESFAEAAKRSPRDPDIYFGLARAYANERQRATEALAKALELNPRHVDSLLFQVDDAIDAEEPSTRRSSSEAVLTVNAKHPRAWAYRAVLAHLAGDKQAGGSPSRGGAEDLEDQSRGGPPDRPQALAEVSLRRRRGLSAEGAWTFDADYRPAKVQLCQDLLRLGTGRRRLAAGGRSVRGTTSTTSSRTTWSRCTTTSRSSARSRRATSSSAWTSARPQIYGPRVLELLTRAKETLVQEVRRRAERADHRRDLPAAEGFRHPHVRPAGRRRVPGRLLRAGDHGQQPGLARRDARRTGRRCCGTSSVTSSRCTRRATRCRAG